MTDEIEQANVGQTIDIIGGEYKGEKGEVLMVRDKSVIVRLGKDDDTGEPIKTVVNHRNYQIIN